MADVPDSYRTTVRRTTSIMVAIGAVGVVAATIYKGWLFGAGFLLGALLSGISFWRWTKVVEGLSPSATPSSRWRWVFRFLSLAVAAYVIVRFLEVTPAAVLLGLLVSAASVIVLIIYELFYGT